MVLYAHIEKSEWELGLFIQWLEILGSPPGSSFAQHNFEPNLFHEVVYLSFSAKG